MLCDRCSHKRVCEFRDSYNETLCKIIDDIRMPSIFKVKLECSHFDAPRILSASDMQTYPRVSGCIVVDNLGRVQG